ncbi:uncharacterized protein A4U43_C08F21560 [Asparagus officinalis]|nr:uncharacterized protein A4U43_C08F21560 [Asparagus officinalis]
MKWHERLLKEEKRVMDNRENRALADAIRELYQFVVWKHLEFIDARTPIRLVKMKCDESRVCFRWDPGWRAEEEEDLWEEGKIQAYRVHNLNKGKGQGEECGCCLTSLESELIAEAPVIEWRLSLDDWGLNQDACIPAEKIAELKLHCTLYKGREHHRDSPSLASLREGGLRSLFMGL